MSPLRLALAGIRDELASAVSEAREHPRATGPLPQIPYRRSDDLRRFVLINEGRRHRRRIRPRNSPELALLLVPLERRRRRRFGRLFHEARIQLTQGIFKRPEVVDGELLPQRLYPALSDVARAGLRPRELLHVLDMHAAPPISTSLRESTSQLPAVAATRAQRPSA